MPAVMLNSQIKLVQELADISKQAAELFQRADGWAKKANAVGKLAAPFDEEVFGNAGIPDITPVDAMAIAALLQGLTELINSSVNINNVNVVLGSALLRFAVAR